ncbi:centrosomal protein of 170 kDa-like isoform X4 [Sinocyclocheilus rhinocerous]|uniref:centrosomal protein of 170 kDa-like isoform X4 n=1 Tax=Sinocyclocheilus rhinocerous TaxID=307959 RepID=UPI0007B92B0F|nr:PREDICTED: centrosomal protein of 170 kDa-like isoform X4 [Sinocyclocheilus rhinocerous]
MSLISWFLVSSGGTRHRLPREMIFVGRDDCELMLQSRSVDKQHAVINYESSSDQHKVKDLGSLNGTFVNDVRIQEQMYITLKIDDKLRFGYDTNLFTVVRGELHVPEEALKHEKFTSQLQLGKKPTCAEPSKTPKSSPDKAKVSKPTEPIAEPAAKPAEPNKGDDKMPGDIAAVHRGTPLYGQPSWWGDGDADDENSFKQENKTSRKKQENSGAESKDTKRSDKSKENGLGPVGAEPSYFEIPSKEGQMAQNSIHEIPTKDTEGTGAAKSATANAAAQANTSFTIEFDDTSPGKVTIKDHVSRPRPKKSPHVGGKDLSTLQAAIMASESKVADWLAQNDPPLVRRESTEDDSKSIKSDVPVHLNRLKGSKHEDGTQSDSENGLGLRFGSKRHATLEERLRAAGVGRVKTEGSSSVSRTAFMIEFYNEDNPRKRRSYSFSQTAPLLGGVAGEGFCPAPPSRPKVVATAADGSKGMPSSLAAVAPTAAQLLLKQRSEEPKVVQSPATTGKPSPTDEAQKQDDDQSDKGTYTIELDKSNPEEEEARRMIDKVFGVEDSQNPGCPEQREASGKVKDGKKLSSTVSERLVEDSVAVGSPRWVSQWASLAANQTRTDPEGSGAEPPAFVHQERDGDAFEAGISIKSTGSTTSSQAERKRRTLPQLPTEEKIKRSEIGEKQDTEPQEKESHNDHKGDGECIGTPYNKDVASSQSKSIQQDGKAGKQSSVRPLGSGERRASEESRRRRSEDKSKGSDGERSGKPLVRQGSFTIEKPSGNVPIELIPRINRQNGGRERSDSVGSMDTATLLKDTEAVMAFLEAKLRDEKKLDPVMPPACPLSPESDIDTASTVSQAAAEGDRKAFQKRRSLSSLYREKSNASTTSKTTTSARERLERKTKTKTTESRSDTHRSVQTASRGRQPSQDLTDDDQTSSLAISDILSSDQEMYSSHSHTKGHFTSTDDLLQSKLDTSKSTRSAKPSKTLQTSTAALTKQAGLPQPRPTRASLLRRARLGDTSDTDLADADRVSVASEVSTTSSTSKPPSGRKAQSRIDMLAQPRRTRLGSFSARSDSEATVSRTTATRVSAETALRLGLRSTNQQVPDSKLTARMRANSFSKLTDPKPKTAPVNSTPSETQLEPESILAEEEPMATNRWRRLPPEYASTSEDEFGSNRNSPKHIRMRPGTTLRTSRLGCPAPVTTSPGGLLLKNRMREQEEYIRDWTAHSEEIARISQDLAKDLATLAREIHDVAGEIDSVSSSGTAPSTTVSTAATTPGSAIDTREELVERVFDESLNFRKIPPVVHTKASEINGRPVELRPRAPDSLDPQAALRRRTWNRDEVRPAVLDSLLLTSVSQLSSKIRQSVDKTAGKIRILFKDKDRNWDDIESKLCLDNEVPLPKSTNKEISSILTELKRVEKQLQVINVMVDPDGTLDALTSLGLTSPTTPKPKSSPGSQSVWGPLPSNGAPQPTLTAISPGPEKPSVGHNFNRTHPTGEESAIASK